MIMPYSERKEAVIEDFEEFHCNLGYSLEHSLYATVGEAEYSREYTQTDECCIYLNFALLLLERKESIEFMKVKLKELTTQDKMKQYKIELKNEFDDFANDISLLNKFLYHI